MMPSPLEPANNPATILIRFLNDIAATTSEWLCLQIAIAVDPIGLANALRAKPENKREAIVEAAQNAIIATSADVTNTAMIISVIDFIFGRPTLRSEDLHEIAAQSNNPVLYRAALQAPLSIRHLSQARSKWEKLREEELSFASLYAFEAGQLMCLLEQL